MQRKAGCSSLGVCLQTSHLASLNPGVKKGVVFAEKVSFIQI